MFNVSDGLFTRLLKDCKAPRLTLDSCLWEVFAQPRLYHISCLTSSSVSCLIQLLLDSHRIGPEMIRRGFSLFAAWFSLTPTYINTCMWTAESVAGSVFTNLICLCPLPLTTFPFLYFSFSVFRLKTYVYSINHSSFPLKKCMHTWTYHPLSLPLLPQPLYGISISCGICWREAGSAAACL